MVVTTCGGPPPWRATGVQHQDHADALRRVAPAPSSVPFPDVLAPRPCGRRKENVERPLREFQNGELDFSLFVALRRGRSSPAAGTDRPSSHRGPKAAGRSESAAWPARLGHAERKGARVRLRRHDTNELGVLRAWLLLAGGRVAVTRTSPSEERIDEPLVAIGYSDPYKAEEVRLMLKKMKRDQAAAQNIEEWLVSPMTSAPPSSPRGGRGGAQAGGNVWAS